MDFKRARCTFCLNCAHFFFFSAFLFSYTSPSCYTLALGVTCLEWIFNLHWLNYVLFLCTSVALSTVTALPTWNHNWFLAFLARRWPPMQVRDHVLIMSVSHVPAHHSLAHSRHSVSERSIWSVNSWFCVTTEKSFKASNTIEKTKCQENLLVWLIIVSSF